MRDLIGKNVYVRLENWTAMSNGKYIDVTGDIVKADVFEKPEEWQNDQSMPPDAQKGI